MSYIKQLSKCLEEWDSGVGENRITELDRLVSSLTIQLGHVDYSDIFKTKPIQSLENLLIELTESTTIFEEIIVDGILFNIYSFLNGNISRRENFIKTNEALLKNAEKLGDVEEVKEMVLATLAKLNAPDYIELAEKEIEIWGKVYNKYFSPSVRDELFNGKTSLMTKSIVAKMSDDDRRQYEEIKEKLKN